MSNDVDSLCSSVPSIQGYHCQQNWGNCSIHYLDLLNRFFKKRNAMKIVNENGCRLTGN